MPSLDTTLHLDTWRRLKAERTLLSRVKQAWSVLRGKNYVYGLEWGDPDQWLPLKYIQARFLRPYLTPSTTAVEIGSGGGRWTRYALGVKKLYAVDYHAEILAEARAALSRPNIDFIVNAGTDFPGVPAGEIDFVFSFGTFMHLDLEIIDAYLRNMRPLLRPASNVVLQYSDHTKPMSRMNEKFSDNDPVRMRELVVAHGYTVREEDTATLWHSSVIRFGLGAEPAERGLANIRA